ncbi:ChrR Cupin-like domain protein [Marinomonas spartinae]|uniref:ChrR Cupin-like domain protein n=1 Tax=Marinomonas spartinae TaxID=1792290 RepID=A0A1A8TKP3_9GAMM|nr:cupin domain-containing protein [Marinomonas spartinae]SBS26689.1 ChrR Cupin-like domain protein [Marinomonas spartinae]SBS32931.1 ChrR Cupin-like domain protein [Marinomonas spartinae]
MLNMDFSRLVYVDTNAAEWVSSPLPGVDRKPLAREEAERGHATSLVRYSAGSIFRAHPHPLGEEILVLDGVFSDESGDYHKGSYFRNPPGSSHAPYSKQGCLLLVKLHQFSPFDLNSVSIDVSAIWSSDGKSTSVRLYEYGPERVYMIREDDNSRLLASIGLAASVELFVLEGQAEYDGLCLKPGGWLRLPDFDLSKWFVQSSCFFWLKTGHF